MTPQDVETRLAGRRDSTTVGAVLAELHADPDWAITEVVVEGRLAQADLLYLPTGAGYALTPASRQRQDGQTADRSTRPTRDKDNSRQ